MLSKRKRAADVLDEKISKKVLKCSGPQSKFIDASWIPPTLVAAERFFSTVKSTMGYLRKRMSQENLDVVILLKLNWDLVTLVDKSKVIVQSKSSDDAGGV
ncbi:hypothetical protein F441_12086 [Phytophthora nicotianae CJ01A1]|uniref:HAT C-terminal dimerisation domain-containing protein n=2 Tax=Phytophthora nicotianae TaxID=4792 RepID=W2PZQ7_PHYN3|nr:hypothetical protein PPTG_23376 [Phytophthora nicotianae INRA-310]ETN06428.1 hypothetical protein PPTG_23376 [Phytophthora nicotianae INRA-310]ETP12561.1 hypothetical protein F441_12086 [Phytophthora nicotianae CJ01A1]